MSLEGDEQDLKRRLMAEVPLEPMTTDPREDDEDDEDVSEEEDDEHGGEARRLQRVEFGGEWRVG
jgi:hypothetical protein